MSQVVLNNIVNGHFRANPEYELVVFDRLSPDHQEAFRELTNDPDFYGVLMPRQGSHRSSKAASQDAALLFLTLHAPGPLPAYARSKLGEQCNEALAGFVLDGVLEIQHADQFVSGPAAHNLIYPKHLPESPRGVVPLLSVRALQYAQALDIDECTVLSARLYSYNRVPLSPKWRQRWPDRNSVARYLGIESGGLSRCTLEGNWVRIRTSSSMGDGWFQWKARTYLFSSGEILSCYKLYVSPRPEYVQSAFTALAPVIAQSRAHHFKIGNDAPGLLRPDKLVIYFSEFESLRDFADKANGALEGCLAQGVPFSANIRNDGLMSWGIDPRPDRGALPWQAQESWRLWVTNRLAVAMLQAKNEPSSGLEPWQFALQRMKLDNIDTSTWTPLDSFKA